MAVPLTDLWATSPMPAMPAAPAAGTTSAAAPTSGGAMPSMLSTMTGGAAIGPTAPPPTAPAGGGGSGLLDMLKGIDFQSLGGQLGVLLDSKMPTRDKMQTLMMLQAQSNSRQQQQQQQQQQQAMNKFGAELATMLDTGDDAKVLEEKLPVLIKKYGAQGVPYQTMMQSAQGLINFKNSREKDKREKAAWEEKLSEAERKKRGENAMRMLTQQAPNPALYQPGSFQQLGVGAPSGRPSETPSKAAPGAPDAAYQNWMQLVRRNPDIPMGDKEKYITSVTGLDPSLQRETSAKALLKQLTGQGGGAGGAAKAPEPLSPSQQKTSSQNEIWKRYRAGEKLTIPEMQRIGIYVDPTSMAYRSLMENAALPLELMSGRVTQGDMADMLKTSRAAYMEALYGPQATPGAAASPTAGAQQAAGPRRRTPGVPEAVMRMAGSVKTGKPFRLKSMPNQWFVKTKDGSIIPVNQVSK